jgi:AcrR family transcriptional regulator
MYDPDKFKAVRSKPSQARGKERVRQILVASLKLFKEYGIEEVTTNDIAAEAQVPIGSLYRYYPNKDAIIVALTELYVHDLSDIFANIAKHPFLPNLSWDEVLLLMVDSWVNYTELNGPFDFLYAEKASPRLQALSRDAWEEFHEAFNAVLLRRCPRVSSREIQICFQLCLAAAELGTAKTPDGELLLHHEAVGAVSSYMLKACRRHAHEK